MILHPEDGQPERARVIMADNQTGSYLVYLLDQGSIQSILPEQVEILLFCVALPTEIFLLSPLSARKSFNYRIAIVGRVILHQED